MVEPAGRQAACCRAHRDGGERARSTASERRWIECLALFVGAPTLLAFCPGFFVLPAVLTTLPPCLALLLRDRSFDRGQLSRLPIRRAAIGALAARTLVGCALVALAVAVSRPALLFHLPRTRPGLWLVIVLAYPLVSVFPQEVLFRAFFFHRYCGLFPTPVARIGASALLFGYAHIALHNLPSIALTAIGGLLFGFTYERTRSIALVSIEHAIYGAWLFTVGFGEYFYTVPLSPLFRL